MAPHGRLAVVLSFALTPASTIVVALRFYTRYFIVGKLAASDWIMLLAVIAAWSSAIETWHQIRYMDKSEAHVNDPETHDAFVVKVLLWLWIGRLNWVIDLCLIKTSILLFYNDISASHKHFRYSIRTLLAINIVSGVALALASIFMCYPVADAWALQVETKGFTGTLGGHCYNQVPMRLFNGGYNLVTDVIIWCLPMVLFPHLGQIPLGRRLGIISIFSVGIVAVVASAVRLRFMMLWSSSLRQRDLNAAKILLLNQVEQHAGLIAGSIPFLRPLVRQALGRVRSRGQASETPEEHLVGECKPNAIPNVLRRPIIPSTSSGESSSHEFRRPEWDLEAIEPVHLYTHGWESGPAP